MASLLLFGGSFNPIHHGHLIVARAAAERLAAQRVVLIPSAAPPHKNAGDLAPPAERLEMCRLATQGDPLFEVSDWELHHAGPNYTLLTVRHFQCISPPGTTLHWLIGQDSLAELHTWYKVGELAAECTLVTAARPGPPTRIAGYGLDKLVSAEDLQRIQANVLTTPLIEISATDIRIRVQTRRAIRYLVPDAVSTHIQRRGLYGATSVKTA